MNADAVLFPRFAVHQIEAGRTRFHCLTAGEGPALLLLHGYPQTHVAWHAVAEALAGRFKVVIPDLSGYGDSEIVGGLAAPHVIAKRQVAGDLARLLDALGIARAAVIGHDRGARVGYRLALDHSERVTGFASITVVPTIDLWDAVDFDFASKAFHWFMLAQPHPLPEQLLAGAHEFFIDWTLERMAQGLSRLHSVALAEYRRCFAKPEVRAAMVADYRAAATVDAEHERDDRAHGRRLACPVHVVWDAGRPSKEPLPLDVWRRWADRVSGAPASGGHLMLETNPLGVLEAIDGFLHEQEASASGFQE